MLRRYDFSSATTAIYAFWQYELCDVFIELVKPVMTSADASPAAKRAMQDALYTALEAGFRLLHPFMPFVTEELWQRLPRLPGVTEGIQTIMLAPYPLPVPAWRDTACEADLEQAMAVVKAVRSLRAAYGLVRRKLCLLHAPDSSSRHAFYLSRRSCPRRARWCTCTRAPTPPPPRSPAARWR